MKKERQHYVPRMYLKNFAENKIINQYDLTNGMSVSTDISNVAICKNLYGNDGQLEGMLNRVETKVAILISKIIELEKLDSIDTDLLLFYILIQNQRTLKVVNNTINCFNEQYDVIKKYYGECDGRHNLPTQDYISALSLSFIRILMDNMRGLAVMLVVNQSSTSFITSDSPVVVYNHVIESSPYQLEYGLGMQGLQILFPINPRLCIIYYDKSSYDCKYKKYSVKRPRLIDDINILVMISAQRFIYYRDVSDDSYIMNIQKKYVIYKNKQSKNKMNVIGLNIFEDSFKLNETNKMVDVYKSGECILLSIGEKRKRVVINIPFLKDKIKFDGQYHLLPMNEE